MVEVKQGHAPCNIIYMVTLVETMVEGKQGHAPCNIIYMVTLFEPWLRVSKGTLHVK